MDVNTFKELLDNSDNIVFFGGAGVSTESNIPDFRSANGLYSENLKASTLPRKSYLTAFSIDIPKNSISFTK